MKTTGETLFKTSKLFTFISEGVEISDYDHIDDDSIEFIYSVVTTNHDFQEKYLKSFSTLKDALSYINFKCSEWDFSLKMASIKRVVGPVVPVGFSFLLLTTRNKLAVT